jgi:hypothetical protein
VLVEAIGVLAVATVGGATAGLNVRDSIRRGAENAEERFGMHRAGADLDIVWLLEDATLLDPEMRQLKD